MEECLSKNEVSPKNYNVITTFIKASDKLLSGPGIQIKYRVLTEVEYYNEIEKIVDVKGKVCDNTNGFVPGIGNFWRTFYQYNFPNTATTGKVWCFASSKVMLLRQMETKIWNMEQKYWIYSLTDQIVIRDPLGLIHQISAKHPCAM